MNSDISDYAVVYTMVGLILQRMEDRGIPSKADHAPLPRGVLTCGEAWTLLPLLFMLLAQKHPELADPDQLSDLLAQARMESACGLPN